VTNRFDPSLYGLTPEKKTKSLFDELWKDYRNRSHF
jgi:hypothetical protein